MSSHTSKAGVKMVRRGVEVDVPVDVDVDVDVDLHPDDLVGAG